MRQGSGSSRRSGWYSAVVVGLLGAGAATAGPPGDADSRGSAVSPVPAAGADSTPYHVRFRITAFLARQHAREGDLQRSLVEYHSMLGMDDASWADNAEGDAMRITRDMDVARMMAESGFFDHSIRVLETARILARVNRDPQLPLIDNQIHSTAELAYMKGLVIKPVQWPTIDQLEMLVEQSAEAPPSEQQQASVAAAAVSEPASQPVETPASPAPPPPAASQPEPVTQTAATPGTGAAPAQFAPAEATNSNEVVTADGARWSELPVVPPAQAEPTPIDVAPSLPADSSIHEAPAAPAPRVRRWADQWSRFARNRQHDAGHSAHVEKASFVEEPHPLVSPDISPSYCGTCAARRATHAATDPGVNPVADAVGLPSRREHGWRISENSRGTIASRLFERLKFGAGLDAVATQATHCRSQIQGTEHDQWTTLPGHAGSAEPAHGSIESRHPAGHTVQPGGPALGSQPVETTAAVSRNSVAKQTAQAAPAPHAAQSTTAAPQPRVAVAGAVSRPGILPLDGTSVMLASLLARAGAEPTAAAQVRIVRSIDRVTDLDSGKVQKEFYVTRLDSTQLAGEADTTGVYEQELVIVESTGEQPLYVAVMPHFVLQLPANSARPITAAQIIEKLATHWPEIHSREIALVRHDNDVATNITGSAEVDASVTTAAVQPGDVLYVNGMGLDRGKILAAAQAIAEAAGAKVRTVENK